MEKYFFARRYAESKHGGASLLRDEYYVRASSPEEAEEIVDELDGPLGPQCDENCPEDGSCSCGYETVFIDERPVCGDDLEDGIHILNRKRGTGERH